MISMLICRLKIFDCDNLYWCLKQQVNKDNLSMNNNRLKTKNWVLLFDRIKVKGCHEYVKPDGL